MTEDEKRRVKSDVIEAMRIAIEDSLSPVAHVPGNMAIAYKAAEAGFAAGIEALAGPPEREGWVLGELAKHPNLSLQTMPSEIEGDPAEWVVFREHGGRSDREWTEIARAKTPLNALSAALLSAAPKP